MKTEKVTLLAYRKQFQKLKKVKISLLVHSKQFQMKHIHFQIYNITVTSYLVKMEGVSVPKTST